MPFSASIVPAMTSGVSLLLIGTTTAYLLKTSIHTKPALNFCGASISSLDMKK